ncbi:hypothetical protein P3372_27245, partial [Vibrio parahaemolyticus]|nr:hypothetical protein [Vibrio parahaemolyticus]
GQLLYLISLKEGSLFEIYISLNMFVTVKYCKTTSYLWNVIPFCLVLTLLSLVHPNAEQKCGIFAESDMGLNRSEHLGKMAAVLTHPTSQGAASMYIYISMVVMELNHVPLPLLNVAVVPGFM